MKLGSRLALQSKALALQNKANTKEPEDDNFTKDFKVLPNRESVKDMLNESASVYIEKVQSSLHNTIIAEKLGGASCRLTVPAALRGIVIKSLKKWANLHEYTFTVDKNTFEIISKEVKVVSAKTIAQRVLKFLGPFAPLVVGAIGITLSIAIPIAAFSVVNILNVEAFNIATGLVCAIGGILGVIFSISNAVNINDKF